MEFREPSARSARQHKARGERSEPRETIPQIYRVREAVDGRLDSGSEFAVSVLIREWKSDASRINRTAIGKVWAVGRSRGLINYLGPLPGVRFAHPRLYAAVRFAHLL